MVTLDVRPDLVEAVYFCILILYVIFVFKNKKHLRNGEIIETLKILLSSIIFYFFDYVVTKAMPAFENLIKTSVYQKSIDQ